MGAGATRGGRIGSMTGHTGDCTPDLVNRRVLRHVVQGAMPADAVALIGTIDIGLGSVDRPIPSDTSHAAGA